MTSEKNLFPVTLMTLMTLAAPASYCEPGLFFNRSKEYNNHYSDHCLIHKMIMCFLITLCAYVQQGYAFGHVGLCMYICGQKTGYLH